ncbi:MAG TPA: LacI family DNA-binding transcriptional regulator [Cyclobacteriaceae bacterium]|nr:LacI family DNA-binding transcriptional regulator [Cyclobacteriaceae bacterium]
MLKKDVTIYDIAGELNVSPSTVSRALKNHYSIGEHTKKKVWALAADKGYRPRSAREMCTIGVIVSHINFPLISSMISGIEQVASENGINVIISQSYGKYKNERALAKTLFEARVGGLIVSLANDTTDTDHFKEFIRLNIPVVFLDRQLDGFNSGTVVIDYFTSAYLATSHLISQGCRRIAFIGETLAGTTYAEKLRGYLESLRAHNVPIEENLILTREMLGAHEGYAFGRLLLNLENPPDAIFSDNDLAAVGVIQYAASKGLMIPQELAVMGFNDDPISLITDPPLSTIAHPAQEMGTVAAQLVLYQSKNSEKPGTTIVLDPKLVARESSLKGVKISCL